MVNQLQIDDGVGGGEPTSTQQYLRQYQLIVTDNTLAGLDLSNLRFKFAVKRSDTATPNTADIRVYNVATETALSMLQVLSPGTSDEILSNDRGKVILQAGYPGNYGVIFQGNIKQIILGRESATDTFVDIIAGDGDLAYNFAIVNSSSASGTSQADQVNTAIKAMQSKGVDAGYIQGLPTQKLPRGKSFYGNAKEYLRAVSQNSNQTWSIQDGKVTFIPVTSYLPGEAVKLTSQTGMIDTPQQTNIGVNVKCLLNPFIRPGGRVWIDNASIADLKINITAQGTASNIPANKQADGVYYVIVVEHRGDTRGTEWYTTIVGVNTDSTVPSPFSVTGGYGP